MIYEATGARTSLMFLPHFEAPYDLYYWTEERQHGIEMFYIIKKQTSTNKRLLISKSFNFTRRPTFSHFNEQEKHYFT